MNNHQYDKLWGNERNWGEGFCGWYFCKEDPRLWIPKKIKKLGVTVNLGHPKGGLMLVALFLTPAIILTVALLATVVASSSVCGG